MYLRTICLAFTLCMVGVTHAPLWASDTRTSPLSSIFEVDGNPHSEPGVPGEDWDSLYNSGGSPHGTFTAYTGVIADGVGDTSHFGANCRDIGDINTWNWNVLDIADRYELVNAQAATYSSSGSEYVYFECDRFDNSSDVCYGMWLLQDSVDFQGGGSFVGTRTVGDLLVLCHVITPATMVDSIAVFRWVGSGGNSDDILGMSGDDHFDIVTTDSLTARAATNASTTNSPWPFTPKVGTPGIFQLAEYFEGGLNLSLICGSTVPAFKTIIIETRASVTLGAYLKDLICTGIVANNDHDYDGIIDPLDNCLFIANPSQMDSNHDGIGDACCCFGKRGNVNMTGITDLSDLSLLIAYLTAIPKPIVPCPNQANVNGVGITDLSDLSMLIAYLTGSPKPILPDCPI